MSGCAGATGAVVGTIVGTAIGVGADVGVERWLNSAADRTFTIPIDDVHRAVIQSLKRMVLTVTADQTTKQGMALAATAANRRIRIVLERLSAGTTRLHVVVKEQGAFFADKETAMEIVRQTAGTLDAEGLL